MVKILYGILFILQSILSVIPCLNLTDIRGSSVTAVSLFLNLQKAQLSSKHAKKKTQTKTAPRLVLLNCANMDFAHVKWN